jgi:hypothetical protein
MGLDGQFLKLKACYVKHGSSDNVTVLAYWPLLNNDIVVATFVTGVMCNGWLYAKHGVICHMQA